MNEIQLEYNQLIGIVADYLRNHKIEFALAGGLAASLYRESIRATDDIDFIISCTTEATNELKPLAEKLKRKITPIRQAELAGGSLFAIKRKSTPIVLVRMIDIDNPRYLPLDFLLANNNWVPNALCRAAELKAFSLPVMSAEDLVIAKLIALSDRPERLQDAQDIKEIINANKSLDWEYLKLEFVRHELTIPRQFKEYFPLKLVQIFSRIKRAR